MSKTTVLTLALACASIANLTSVNAQSSNPKPTANKPTANKQATTKTTGTSGTAGTSNLSSTNKTPGTTNFSGAPKTASTAKVATTATQKSTKAPAVSNTETTASLTAVNLIQEKQAITNVKREPSLPYSPKVIDLTEQTIRLGGGKKEELMFGFAAGDKIIFNFQEADSKDLKEIEIIEYPSLSRFSDYKTSRVKNKELIVAKQGIFIFRLKNSSLAKRICKVKIQRVPSSEASEKFNSSVSWINKQDTIWQSYTTDVVIGYDTAYVAKTKKVLLRTEVEEQLISDQVERINPQQKLDNRASVVVSLPVNNRGAYKTTRVLSWAYWVAGGPEATRAWQQNLRTIRNQNMDYYTPLGAFANGNLNALALPLTGQQMNYFIADQANRDLFMQKQPFRYIDNGVGFGGYKKFTTADQCQGSYYLCIENLNTLSSTDYTVKVIALVERSYFEDQAYEEQVITPITETQIKQQPYIKNTNVPVTGM